MLRVSGCGAISGALLLQTKAHNTQELAHPCSQAAVPFMPRCRLTEMMRRCSLLQLHERQGCMLL